MPRRAKPQDQSTYAGRTAARIRARRVKAKKTVEQAAAAAGKPQKTWYNWEAGRRLPLEALPAIAAALGCSVGSLLPE